MNEFLQVRGQSATAFQRAVSYSVFEPAYDGMKENGTWYVLRQVPPGTQGENVDKFQPLPAGFEYTPPPPNQLPWTTVPGPFRWVSAVWIAGVAAILLPFLFSDAEHDPLLPGIAMIGIFSSFLYEALRTGAIRHNFGPSTYATKPGSFLILVVAYILMILCGVALVCMALFEWPRAV